MSIIIITYTFAISKNLNQGEISLLRQVYENTIHKTLLLN